MKMKEKPIEEFTLPKKWCIKLSTREINDAANSISLWPYGRLFWEDNLVFTNCYIGYDGRYSCNLLEEGYSEITFDQFKKYVLKQEEPKTNNMKKPFAITGSVALKEAFVKEAGLSFYTNDSVNNEYIIPCENPENINKMKGMASRPKNYVFFSLPQQYKEALEYVKTYWKEEFNVGDWIVVENSNKLQNGCTGCPQGTFQIINKDKYIHHNGLHEYNEGFYVQTERAIWRISKQGVRKATKEEIEKAQKACNLPEMSTYKAEIKEGKLHYGCKSFSKQEVQVIIDAAAVLEKFSSYGASLFSTEVKTSGSSLSIEKLKTILNKLS